ncbi:hypothetical protein JKP88DRAFT_329414 [Tribonema minus]|uniref:CG-1 domain-containing protein n=1 Tax=Tribonema minus TaxID=303371 RepID=A0A835YS93_9STRA|nr:hypothetical protein JKP88DRAFT_329414 [Tribonema minus]
MAGGGGVPVSMPASSNTCTGWELSLGEQQQTQEGEEDTDRWRAWRACVRHVAKCRWLTLQELLVILSRYHAYGIPLVTCHARPPESGALLLCATKDVSALRQDGIEWVKRPNTKKVREDHVSLKLNGAVAVRGSYTHAVHPPTLHRRRYTLGETDAGVTLVHYLDVARAEARRAQSPHADLIAQPLTDRAWLARRCAAEEAEDLAERGALAFAHPPHGPLAAAGAYTKMGVHAEGGGWGGGEGGWYARPLAAVDGASQVLCGGGGAEGGGWLELGLGEGDPDPALMLGDGHAEAWWLKGGGAAADGGCCALSDELALSHGVDDATLSIDQTLSNVFVRAMLADEAALAAAAAEAAGEAPPPTPCSVPPLAPPSLPQILDLSPEFGWEGGGTKLLVCLSAPLPDLDGSALSVWFGEQRVGAEVLSATAVRCVAPPQPHGAPARVPVSLSAHACATSSPAAAVSDQPQLQQQPCCAQPPPQQQQQQQQAAHWFEYRRQAPPSPASLRKRGRGGDAAVCGSAQGCGGGGSDAAAAAAAQSPAARSLNGDGRWCGSAQGIGGDAAACGSSNSSGGVTAGDGGSGTHPSTPRPPTSPWALRDPRAGKIRIVERLKHASTTAMDICGGISGGGAAELAAPAAAAAAGGGGGAGGSGGLGGEELEGVLDDNALAALGDEELEVLLDRLVVRVVAQLLAANDTALELAANDTALEEELRAIDPSGYALLHHAALYGLRALVPLLLDKGAAVGARTRCGRAQTPLHLAAAAGHAESPLRLAAAAGHAETPLHLAVAAGHVEAVRAAAHARNAAMSDAAAPGRAAGHAETPLHLAAAAGHVEVAEQLLAACACALCADADGCTPAQLAARAGHAALAARLGAAAAARCCCAACAAGPHAAGAEAAAAARGAAMEECSDDDDGGGGDGSSLADSYAGSGGGGGGAGADSTTQLLHTAFSSLSLHEKCAVSLSLSSGTPTKGGRGAAAGVAAAAGGAGGEEAGRGVDGGDFSGVMSATDKGRLDAAMSMMGPEELEELEGQARKIQQNLRAWALRRNYRSMRAAARTLQLAWRERQRERTRGGGGGGGGGGDEEQDHGALSQHMAHAAGLSTAAAAALERGDVCGDGGAQWPPSTPPTPRALAQRISATTALQAAARGMLARRNFALIKRKATALLALRHSRAVRHWMERRHGSSGGGSGGGSGLIWKIEK